MGAHSVPRIMTAASFGFLSGILLHAGWLRPVPFLAMAVAMLPLLFVRHRIVCIGYATCLFGFIRFDMTLPLPSEALAEAVGREASFIGIVREMRIYQATIAVRTMDDRVVSSRSLISVSPGSATLSEGQTVRVACRLAMLDLADKKSRFLARRGAFFQCKGTTVVRLVAFAPPYFAPAALANWRKALSARIRAVFPGDEGALLSGILYGERGFTKRMNDAFRMAGMTHLIAVSGSNITLVVSLFVPFLLVLGYRRTSAIVLSGLGILLFAFFVGAEASVIRAAIMGWLALLARAFGRKPKAGHLLLVAAAVMTLADPWAPAFDAGFALSFLATWGLIALSPFVSERLRFVPERFGLREITATTFSATLVTTPYSLWAFQESSLAGLITNLFAIPLIGLAMAWGALAIAVGPVIPAVAWPAQGFLHAILRIAETANRFPWLAYALPIPLWAMAAIYTLIAGAGMHLKRKKYPQPGVLEAHIPSRIRAFVRAF